MPAATDAACPIPTLNPKSYAAWRASELGMITERIERALLIELLGDIAGKKVLDIGCGDGDFTLELRRRGALVVGLDASEAMIAAARTKVADAGISFQVGSAQHLPFEGHSFDVVVAMTILCFVKDARPVFAEIARVLRPGGRLVIGELGKRSTWAAERRLRAWLGSPIWRLGHFRTPGELQSAARSAGLVPGEVHGAVYYPRLSRAARWMQPLDKSIGRVTRIGAAFLALSASKPMAGPR